MLIYGEAFLKSNQEALDKLKELMGEASYNAAIMNAPDCSEDNDENVEKPY